MRVVTSRLIYKTVYVELLLKNRLWVIVYNGRLMPCHLQWVISLRIICSSCSLKEKRITASNHIFLKTGLSNERTSLILKAVSLYFILCIIIINNNNNTEMVQELSLWNSQQKCACSVNTGISFQIKTAQTNKMLRSIHSSRLIRHHRKHLSFQWPLISEMVVRKYTFMWLH